VFVRNLKDEVENKEESKSASEAEANNLVGSDGTSNTSKKQNLPESNKEGEDVGCGMKVSFEADEQVCFTKELQVQPFQHFRSIEEARITVTNMRLIVTKSILSACCPCFRETTIAQVVHEKVRSILIEEERQYVLQHCQPWCWCFKYPSKTTLKVNTEGKEMTGYMRSLTVRNVEWESSEKNLANLEGDKARQIPFRKAWDQFYHHLDKKP